MNDQTLQEVLRLPADLPRLPARVNRNYSLPVIDYYREGWNAQNNASDPAFEPAAKSAADNGGE